MPQRLLRVNALVNERRSLQSGAVAFFQKPANEVELMGVIRATYVLRGDGSHRHRKQTRPKLAQYRDFTHKARPRDID